MTRQLKATKPIKAKKVRDSAVEELQRKDLGDDIRASGVRPVVIRPKSLPTSITLDRSLIEKLRQKAAKRGVGYQTMLKIIVNEHVDEY